MTYETNYLAHYGIKGQKWGVRRYQNPDGTLTPEGKERYGSSNVTKENVVKQLQKNYDLYSSAHKNEALASQRFKDAPSMKEYFKIEDEVKQILNNHHRDPKSKYMEYAKASKSYKDAKRSGASDKELTRLKKAEDKSLADFLNEDMWDMYQYVSQNYSKKQAPSILAMLYGGIYNHDYGD